MCMPVLCSNQRNCELMSRATLEQRRNNSGSYDVAFTTASQHCANGNWHWTYIGPMSDISNVGVTNVGPTLNRCSKMMIRRWPNVNPTVGSTIPRWATLHWPNVKYQRWSNITDVIGPTLGQHTLAIWVALLVETCRAYAIPRCPSVRPSVNNSCYRISSEAIYHREFIMVPVRWPLWCSYTQIAWICWANVGPWLYVHVGPTSLKRRWPNVILLIGPT